MSQTKVVGEEEGEIKEPFVEVEARKSRVQVEDPIQSHEGNQIPPAPSTTTSQEETITKKYGGLLRKKPPLISMGHEHAFFDSADWELRKQGAQKSKGLQEKLRPKLEPTPHQHLGSRRLAYDPPQNDVGDEGCKDDDGESCTCGTGLVDRKRTEENDNEKDDLHAEEDEVQKI